MMDYNQLKERIQEEVAKNLQDLILLNDDLADNPEISGQEYESSRKMVELLKAKGFETEYPFAGYETAFKATYGTGKHRYKVAIMAEYDALPEIGHACGHCVSGSISLLAGIAMSKLQDELDCDIHIIGTPIEETDGAKCGMVKKGVFDPYDMAMMIHMYDTNLLYCTLLALDCYTYTFKGKAAHASAAPWEGRNALNGAQLMMHALDMLRQHVTPDVRIHGVYRNGGAAPNIVPEDASIELYVRALEREYLNGLLKKVDDCARGAAIATQTEFIKAQRDMPYDNLKNNDFGLGLLKDVYGELGIEIGTTADNIFGSSDAGNVSMVCPTFHPTLQIVPEGTPIHTRDFADSVKTPLAHETIGLGAKVIGLQIAKIFSDEKNIRALKEAFNR